TTPSAEHLAVVSVENDEIKALLASLSPDQAEVMLLRVLGGLTIAEIANLTERTQGAVKQLQRRAVAQLQKLIEESSVEPVPLSISSTIAPSR
ncbi:MAG: sigma-70 family RNA polymerase sigma factor, partial [Actinomycetes bacterium]